MSTKNFYFVDFKWDAIENSIKKTNVKFKPIPKFPEVKRDFALLIDEDISFEAIYKDAKHTDQKYLKETEYLYQNCLWVTILLELKI